MKNPLKMLQICLQDPDHPPSSSLWAFCPIIKVLKLIFQKHLYKVCPPPLFRPMPIFRLLFVHDGFPNLLYICWPFHPGDLGQGSDWLVCNWNNFRHSTITQCQDGILWTLCPLSISVQGHVYKIIYNK